MTFALALWLGAAAVAQTAPPGVIRGVIVDARDGTPLEKVSVRIQDTRQAAITGADGSFQFDAVTPGRHELSVSSVDYILARRRVDVAAGQTVDITIPISAGTGTYTESINVTGTVERGPRPGAIELLRSNELQQLRGVITNDPVRAIHVLPGVATGDDLRSEFSVRGLPVANMNFTFEGISTPLLVHTVQGVQDTGSIAMVNGDVLQEISLAAGSYPQRHGGHTGAQLEFLMREGSRERLRGLFRPSITDTSLVVEGPIGRSGKGSWLVSARKSYLGSVIRKIDPENTFAFGFHDTQAKVAYDLGPKHQIQLAATAGRSRLNQDAASIDMFDVKGGVNDTGVVVVSWRSVASPRLLMTQRLAADGNSFRNRNIDDTVIHRGRRDDMMYRTDWSYSRSEDVAIEGGGELRRSAASRFELGPSLVRPQFELHERFSDSSFFASSYLLARRNWKRASISPGLRVDHATLTGRTSVSPWMETRWQLRPSVTARAAGGIYRQNPEFALVTGLRGSTLADARSYHMDAGIEGPLGAALTWQAIVYNREDRDYPWLPDAEFRVAGGRLVFPSLVSRYESTLDGHSRGVEVRLRRSTPNGLSGWIAYSAGTTRYRDFAADYDQRHTLNVYGVYRFSDRMSFSSRFREGSNFPVSGFYERRGAAYFLSGERNRLRVPVYARLDVRANRTFSWNTRRLTAFAEVLNLLGRDNVRAASPGINPVTHQVFGLFDSMFPTIPSAGLLLEF